MTRATQNEPFEQKPSGRHRKTETTDTQNTEHHKAPDESKANKKTGTSATQDDVGAMRRGGAGADELQIQIPTLNLPACVAAHLSFDNSLTWCSAARA